VTGDEEHAVRHFVMSGDVQGKGWENQDVSN